MTLGKRIKRVIGRLRNVRELYFAQRAKLRRIRQAWREAPRGSPRKRFLEARKIRAHRELEHLERVKRKRAKKLAFLRDKRDDKADDADGVVTPDAPWNPNNKPVAAWMVKYIDQAWKLGWRGVLNSGWRSPEYSEGLCIQICGAPSCPGTCAGRSSNHAKHVEPEGAIDVSDPALFASKQRQIGSGLWNALGAADPWHFSRSGR